MSCARSSGCEFGLVGFRRRDLLGWSMLILASGSATRLRMLRRAGVEVCAEAVGLDEAAVKDSCLAAALGPAQIAELLAQMKAFRCAAKHAGRLVLGADQVLWLEGRILDKPFSLEQARDQLLLLRGRTHQLVSSAVMVCDQQRLWHHTDTAELTVRNFSQDFLDLYLNQVGDRVMESIGGYQIEEMGVQLFSHVRGDFFTILGLPLLPLLAYLREREAVAD